VHPESAPAPPELPPNPTIGQKGVSLLGEQAAVLGAVVDPDPTVLLRRNEGAGLVAVRWGLKGGSWPWWKGEGLVPKKAWWA